MLLASEGVVALGRLSQERCGVLKRPQSGLGGLGMAIGGGGGGGGGGDGTCFLNSLSNEISPKTTTTE